MSWEQPTYSFGNPNAQPPTPTKTPTSAQFPSPTFQTPKDTSSSFEDRSGWTPTFAEEYSVFNATPGRLTSSHPTFLASAIPGPSPNPQQSRRLSSTTDIAAELATHVHHFSPNPNLSLPPVDPSNQLPSSPGPYVNRFDDSRTVTPRKPKKSLNEAFSGQTATPPATSSKGTRRLAPKLSSETMQNDPQHSLYGTSPTTSNQPNMMTYPTTSDDFFGFPMSAPATAPVFSNTKPFWDPDSSMGGMDLDFNDTDPFTTSSHRLTNSADWARSNQMFQETVNLPAQDQIQNLPQPAKLTPKRQRVLAPKIPKASLSSPELPRSTSMSFHDPPVSADMDIFSIYGLEGGVDPGILLSSSELTATPTQYNTNMLSSNSTGHVSLQPYSQQLQESMRYKEDEMRDEVRRSRSVKDRRLERGAISSPVKGSARPGLHRSISDSRGRRSQDRVLSRSGGRMSPVKRPSALNSIPEFKSPPKLRTEVKFVIDNNGRARTENVVVKDKVIADDDELSFSASSTDEEGMIPSQHTSFNLPQTKAPNVGRFETSNYGGSIRRQSTSGSGYSQSESSRSSQLSTRRGSLDSEAETVMEDDGSGDAATELRKMMENRKSIHLNAQNPSHRRRTTEPRNRRYVNYAPSSNISPTTVTDPDSATPSSTRSGTTRCVCSLLDNEGFMIQCESCDNWLHGNCVGIDHRSLPPVYVCAFCAQTPNMRGGRIREPGRGKMQTGSSPLAHKAFQSFR